ncbi:transcription factor IIIC subunit delta N-term-domain-containing protein [Sphaerosporella brunnea]|uniref:Transcription factor IIIC subunit delta N-term-domain-containing protein n=1 Tax=Sphaerosporella brunnea TaxID=1250544 RepID=A0A5J5FA73_9PEZI|nr:transcription factor IIIC subunit delta N-term-domain-containing protein [Sphaerosporella brunnea]
MLKNVRLRLLPNVGNCLAWSPEGTLAMVSGEDVIILKSPQFWHARANLRQLIIDAMDEEIVPAPTAIYSVGEEQGPGYAKEVQWSPLGCSRYRRCLLAVVSTNHKLYIFEPFGQVLADMRLLHALSPTMGKYHKRLPAHDEEFVSGPVRKRLRSRCRAIAWSSPCRADGNRWGESLLAVANDYLEIVLFRFLFLTCGCFREEGLIGAGCRVVEWMGKRATHAATMCWSPWLHITESKYWALLTYVWNGQVYATRVTIDMGDRTVAVLGEKLVLGKALSDRHPIFLTASAPELIAGRIVVACAAQLHTTVVTINSKGEVQFTEKFPNDFIEAVTGLTFAPSQTPDTTIVQVLSIKGKSQTITYTVPSNITAAHITSPTTHPEDDVAMPDAATDEATASTWPVVLSEAEQDFLAQHEISSATIRGYGMAVSPLGGITAVAVSFHPKDSLEYITAVNEKTFILFGTAPGSGGGGWKSCGFSAEGELPNPISVSTEAVLLEAMAFQEIFTSRIQTAISAATAAGQPNLEAITYPSNLSNNNNDVEEFLANHTLLCKPLNALRYSAALKIISRPHSQAGYLLAENPNIIAASIISALSAPRSLCADQLSKRILYSFACVGLLGLYSSSMMLEHAKKAFEWLDSETPTDVRFDLEFGIVAMRTRAGSGEVRGGGNGGKELNVENGFVSSMERCLICGHGMVWRDLRIAECTEGHRFSRCVLTFLPITDPKLTRECVVCARTVLGGYVQGEEGMQGLAKAVFGGWEACLLCGGRYWAEMS